MFFFNPCTLGELKSACTSIFKQSLVTNRISITDDQHILKEVTRNSVVVRFDPLPFFPFLFQSITPTTDKTMTNNMPMTGTAMTAPLEEVVGYSVSDGLFCALSCAV